MKRIRDFLKTSLLGGLVVILPVAILIFVFKWIFNLVTNMVQPLTDLVMARSQMQEILADILVIAVILSLCFVIGVFVRTRLGKWIFQTLENKILKIAPGYSLIKETVMQFVASKKSPFSSVALVQIFGNETLASAFVTDTHENGSYTVFVPTGPNPTSGNIYHLEARFVHPIDVPVEDAMRSIISCGAGSTKLVKALSKNS